jgi:hypothetical protein
MISSKFNPVHNYDLIFSNERIISWFKVGKKNQKHPLWTLDQNQTDSWSFNLKLEDLELCKIFRLFIFSYKFSLYFCLIYINKFILKCFWTKF